MKQCNNGVMKRSWLFLYPLLFFIIYILFTAPKTYAVSCSPSAGGAYTISSSCTFPYTVDGVENGSLTVQGGTTLTVNAGQTIVYNPAYNVTIQGTVAINSTGKLYQGAIYIKDADSDGYPADTSFAITQVTGSYRRRYQMSTFSADIDDANANATVASSYTIFATSTTYTASQIGGLAGADSICQTRANAASLTGTYKAWLSDSTISAAERLYHSPVPYKLVNGTTVANTWTDLTDGSIAAGITITELGTTFSTSTATCSNAYSVHTGTDSTGFRTYDGLASVSTCGDWTDNSGQSSAGWANQTDGTWTNHCAGGTCGGSFGLICIQQTPQPSAPTCANVSSLSVDVDHDGYAASGGPYTVCTTDAYTINGRSYYQNTDTGIYQWFSSGSSLGSDCYDRNRNAYTGSSYSSSYNRGDGSYDYNCDSNQTQQATCVSTISSTYSCTSSMPSGISGWVSSAPACGASGSFRYCWNAGDSPTCSSGGSSVNCQTCSGGPYWYVTDSGSWQNCN